MTGAFTQAFDWLERRNAKRFADVLHEHPEIVTEAGDNNNTLLNLAVSIEADDGPIVRALLAAGADPNAPNVHGWTPLHQAAYANRSLNAKLLTDHGADVSLNARGDGGTPLAVALFWGHTQVASFLATFGVHPNNLRINAALDSVEKLSQFFHPDGTLTPTAGIGRGFYRPHGGFPEWEASDEPQEIVDEAFNWAARSGAIGSMSFLLAHGAQIDSVPCRGTPLMWAVFLEKAASVHWLLQQGAEPNFYTPFHGRETGGCSALHLAAQTNDVRLVQLLLDHGADHTLRDENYDGDPAGWAEFAQADETLALLRSLGTSY